MIYLVSQMILALCAAIVLGVALGWLIHRTAYSKQTHNLKQHIARRQALLEHAQSDMSMLTEDFDELQQQSHEQITALQSENSQIPDLSTNLEKSQLLVKQMMQRHDGALRDLTNDNQRLTKKLAKIEAQEHVKSQLAAKLDERRGTHAQSLISESTDSQATTIETETPATDSGDDSLQELSDIEAPKTSRFAAAEADDDPFDEVIEVEQELQQELDDAEDYSAAESPAPAAVDAEPEGLASAPVRPDSANLVIDQEPLASASTPAEITPLASADIATPFELPEPSVPTDTPASNDALSDSSEADDLDAVYELDDMQDLTNPYPSTGAREPEFDGSTDTAKLFEPVGQQDDLQQIFGIGPLTEKALNELGITSYSQLATLERPEIQRIADALEIGPARIERDNWVGNARRQLEEVLEQL